MLAVIYLLSPIDILPDMLPILGRIDDLLILLISVTTLLGMAPEDLLKRAKREDESPKKRGQVIDADYRFTDESDESDEQH